MCPLSPPTRTHPIPRFCLHTAALIGPYCDKGHDNPGRDRIKFTSANKSKPSVSMKTFLEISLPMRKKNDVVARSGCYF